MTDEDRRKIAVAAVRAAEVAEVLREKDWRFVEVGPDGAERAVAGMLVMRSPTMGKIPLDEFIAGRLVDIAELRRAASDGLVPAAPDLSEPEPEEEPEPEPEPDPDDTPFSRRPRPRAAPRKPRRGR